MCPGCDMAHLIYVRDGVRPRPSWAWNGDAERPTFEPSIRVQWSEGDPPVQRCCHSFVRDGRIQFLPDCTHALAGQTVALPDFR